MDYSEKAGQDLTTSVIFHQLSLTVHVFFCGLHYQKQIMYLPRVDFRLLTKFITQSLQLDCQNISYQVIKSQDGLSLFRPGVFRDSP